MLSIVFPKWQNKRGAVVENRLLHKHTRTSTLLSTSHALLPSTVDIILSVFFSSRPDTFFIHPFLFSYILLLGGLHFWNTHSLYFFEAALVISLRSAFSARGKKKKYGKAKVEFLLNGARSGSPYQRDYILPIDGPGREWSLMCLRVHYVCKRKVSSKLKAYLPERVSHFFYLLKNHAASQIKTAVVLISKLL
ncbi:hypothetical protein CEXT_778511 [Caerostris extrusa]|uniref:Uncharacterized protein n=1 Tax=Caerostris extrusa TaxID=172846 RepID=A0AAV4TV51_CAEEX|nr:hypothetical protein CEXT_778511 [Caerostris extrusa]